MKKKERIAELEKRMSKLEKEVGELKGRMPSGYIWVYPYWYVYPHPHPYVHPWPVFDTGMQIEYTMTCDSDTWTGITLDGAYSTAGAAE